MKTINAVTGEVSTVLEMAASGLTPNVLGSKLSNIRRFQGHPRALSVAQHQVVCSRLAANAGESVSEIQACLTHDIAEAFLGDWHGPTKPQECHDLEEAVLLDLWARGWEIPCTETYKKYDKMCFELELRFMWPDAYGRLTLDDLNLLIVAPGEWERMVLVYSAFTAR